jgi:hypothetical protein
VNGAPDYLEPVEGWRVWRVGSRDGAIVLQSVFVDAVWEPGRPLEARCEHRRRSLLRPWRVQSNEHPAPEEDCSCGIYAASTRAAARRYLGVPSPVGTGMRVIGRVSLWGDVVESESGWRASSGYPSQLFVPIPMEHARRSLRRRQVVDEVALALEHYGVPVELVAGEPGESLLTALSW